MDKARCCKKLGISSKAACTTTNAMDLVITTSSLETNTLAIGRRIRKTDKESNIKQVEMYTKGNGRIINSTDGDIKTG